MDKKNKVLEFIKEHKTEILAVGGVLLAGAAIGVLCKTGFRKKPSMKLMPNKFEKGWDLPIPKELNGLVTDIWADSGSSWAQVITEPISINNTAALFEKLRQLPELDGDKNITMILGFKRAK